VNALFRGVALPAGEHRLVMSYRPPSVWLGAVISGAAWAALASIAGGCWWANRWRR